MYVCMCDMCVHVHIYIYISKYKYVHMYISVSPLALDCRPVSCYIGFAVCMSVHIETKRNKVASRA